MHQEIEEEDYWSQCQVSNRHSICKHVLVVESSIYIYSSCEETCILFNETFISYPSLLNFAFSSCDGQFDATAILPHLFRGLCCVAICH